MKSTFASVMRVLSAFGPALLAAAGAQSIPASSHDESVLRAVGAGSTGIFHALDLLVAAPMLVFPLGTRAFRAALASALVTGVAASIAFDLAFALAVAAVPAALDRLRLRGSAVSPRLLASVSAVAVLSTFLAPAWQTEAASPGGAVTGALLVLLALRASVLRPIAEPLPLPTIAVILGLAASYEPLVFFAALAAVTPALFTKAYGPLTKPRAIEAGLAFTLGLAPLALGAALLRRPPELALRGPHHAFVAFIERPVTPRSLALFASGDVGLMLVAVAAGFGLSVWVPATRKWMPALGFVVLVGALSFYAGAPAGDGRYGAPILAALAAMHVASAVALGVLVLGISRARVPFAEASAALVVVLQLVMPIVALDATATQREARFSRAASVWNDVAWGAAPPASVILVADAETMRRVAVARATGEAREDLIFVPAYDLHGRAAARALMREPKLAPLYRDVALGVPPEELSLSELAGQRPLIAAFDPKWDRSLARHLVPVGLSTRFETEPRGASDRKHGFDIFTPGKERLVHATIAKRDADLAAATARLLRARAIGIAAAGERELLSRALDDLRAFAPEDPVSATLVRRIVTSKGGPIEIRDLSP